MTKDLRQYSASRPPCLICTDPKTNSAFTKNGCAFYRCSSCDFIFVHPPPEETAYLYGQDYFCGAVQGFGYVNYDEDKVAMKPFFEAVLDQIKNLQKKPGRLLDVGAATGFFVKLADQRGWKAMGLEISPYAAAAASQNGATVVQGTLQSVAFEPASFDVITLLDVIEHVADPQGVVDKCAQLLKSGGLLVINTPDTSSLWAKVFGSRWHAYCPPEHLSYFNPVNLSRLLQNHGFEIKLVTKLSKRFSPAYVFSMLFRWQKLQLWKWLTKGIENTFLNHIVLPINIRDNFFIIARRGS